MHERNSFMPSHLFPVIRKHLTFSGLRVANDGIEKAHASIADENSPPLHGMSAWVRATSPLPSVHTTHMQTIILIDEDREIQQAVVPALRERFPDYAICASADGAEGWELIQAQQPELVIFDLSLPSIDGLDLFLRVRSVAPSTQVVLTSANRFVLQDLERKFSTHGPLQTIAKPFQSGQMIDRSVAGFYGEPISTLRDVSFASVLQLLAFEGKNCWLDVSTPISRGSCRFLRGEIVYAVCGQHVGIDALQAMMRLRAPGFSVFAADDSPPACRNVFARFNELLLLCCTAFDEGIQVA